MADFPVEGFIRGEQRAGKAKCGLSLVDRLRHIQNEMSQLVSQIEPLPFPCKGPAGDDRGCGQVLLGVISDRRQTSENQSANGTATDPRESTCFLMELFGIHFHGHRDGIVGTKLT